MADDVAVARAPADGLWRVGKNPPLVVTAPSAEMLLGPRDGCRYDVPDVEILYFASDLEGCFGEVLAPLRPSALAALVDEEWGQSGKIRPGFVNAGWRHRRTAVHVQVDRGEEFLDVEALETHQVLRDELATGLAALGVTDLDVGAVRGPDKRATRLIADWAFNAQRADGGYRFAGIRYCSRLESGWVCWALFPDVQLDSVRAFTIEREMPELAKVAARYGLHVY